MDLNQKPLYQYTQFLKPCFHPQILQPFIFWGKVSHFIDLQVTDIPQAFNESQSFQYLNHFLKVYNSLGWFWNLPLGLLSIRPLSWVLAKIIRCKIPQKCASFLLTVGAKYGKVFLINTLTGQLMDEAKERQKGEISKARTGAITNYSEIQFSYFYTCDVSVSLHKDLLFS